MPQLIRPDIILLAGLDDLEYENESAAEPIYNVIKECNKQNILVISNYPSAKGLIREFPEHIQQQEDARAEREKARNDAMRMRKLLKTTTK